MANWLDITNTIINYTTMQRVGDLSGAQQQVADQMLAVDYRKQQDNTLLSHLVDIYVKVMQFVQDKQYFDAFLSAGVGVMAFKQLYPKIIDADTKLKAFDTQVKLLETIRSTILDSSIKSTFVPMLAQYINTFNDVIQQVLSQLKDSNHQLVWLDPAEEWQIDVDEELTPIQDLFEFSTKDVIFRKGNLYKVTNVNTSGINGFILKDDFGVQRYYSFAENGGADQWAFFDPPIPSLEKEIVGWELCNKLFSDEFLSENLKSLRANMLAIYLGAFEQSRLTMQNFIERISLYRQHRHTAVQRALKSPGIQAASKPIESWLPTIIVIIIALISLIFLLKNC